MNRNARKSTLADDAGYRVTRTYRLRPATVATIDRIAGAYNLYQSTLIDLALSHVLAQIEAGELVVEQAPVRYVATGLSNLSKSRREAE